jgi:hypothetical protein
VTKYLKENNPAGESVDADQLAKVDDYVTCMKEIDEDDWKAASADRASGKTESAAITDFDAASSACQAKAPK